ncbi:MAG: hypothetical protein HY549_11150 [Elusimicrobia bacterium]|nr:hypothetical protein [Elusimicrobiota bacterium]
MLKFATTMTLPTGTSQDLMSIVARAYELHRPASHVLPSKPGALRAWIEPPLVLLGFLLSLGARLLPADWVLAGHEWIFSKLASPHRYAFQPASPSLERAHALSRRLDRGGSPVAMLAVLSHPPVLGELAHLNFELVRHGMQALRQIRGRPCRPRLVVAIDPFALDTVSLHEEGVYAGFMGLYHIGVDRLALHRNALTRLLLGPTSWERMAGRLLGVLKAGGEVAMVLAGGVPSTARVLYGTREWMMRCRGQRPVPLGPAEVLRRLRADPLFRHFEADGGPKKPASVWRLLEAFAMSAVGGILMPPEAHAQPCCAQNGTLTDVARRHLDSALKALGYGKEQSAKALAELEEELARQTPYRSRLFNALARRAVASHTPLVFLPIVHRLGAGGASIEIRAPWALESCQKGRLSGWIPDGSAEKPWEGSVEGFAQTFVRENFL